MATGSDDALKPRALALKVGLRRLAALSTREIEPLPLPGGRPSLTPVNENPERGASISVSVSVVAAAGVTAALPVSAVLDCLGARLGARLAARLAARSAARSAAAAAEEEGAAVGGGLKKKLTVSRGLRESRTQEGTHRFYRFRTPLRVFFIFSLFFSAFFS